MLPLDAFRFANMINQRVPFLLIDARLPLDIEPFKMGYLPIPFLRITEREVLLHKVKEETPDLSYPVIILCEDGVRSKEWAGDLSQTGFINIYFIENGEASLK